MVTALHSQLAGYGLKFLALPLLGNDLGQVVHTYASVAKH